MEENPRNTSKVIKANFLKKGRSSSRKRPSSGARKVPSTNPGSLNLDKTLNPKKSSGVLNFSKKRGSSQAKKSSSRHLRSSSKRSRKSSILSKNSQNVSNRSGVGRRKVSKDKSHLERGNSATKNSYFTALNKTSDLFRRNNGDGFEQMINNNIRKQKILGSQRGHKIAGGYVQNVLAQLDKPPKGEFWCVLLFFRG